MHSDVHNLLIWISLDNSLSLIFTIFKSSTIQLLYWDLGQESYSVVDHRGEIVEASATRFSCLHTKAFMAFQRWSVVAKYIFFHLGTWSRIRHPFLCHIYYVSLARNWFHHAYSSQHISLNNVIWTRLHHRYGWRTKSQSDCAWPECVSATRQCGESWTVDVP